ncbi:MAG: carbohydrate-binding protein [Clostridiales bacterium]|jgi:hypothetical protein|nr:carbohydrate-binding protein [Clostridiales bacterium]
MKLKVMDKNGLVRSEAAGNALVTLVHPGRYHNGDAIVLECEPGFYEARLDDGMPAALVFIPNNEARYVLPLNRRSYSPRSFKGKSHLITVRAASEEIVRARRNLALNPYDSHDSGIYPHALANSETRGEAIFAARNAIDGACANQKHYPYPYQSWGINKDPNAWLKVEFGVAAEIDTIVLVLRADFPHDNYWVQADLAFSDGSVERIKLEKTGEPQKFKVSKRAVAWVKLENLKQSDDPSPYPALTEIEAWGRITEG